MVRKKQHNDGLVDGNIHSKKRPSTTKFQYPIFLIQNFQNVKIKELLKKEFWFAGVGEMLDRRNTKKKIALFLPDTKSSLTRQIEYLEEYLDADAKTDEYAQEEIRGFLKDGESLR